MSGADNLTPVANGNGLAVTHGAYSPAKLAPRAAELVTMLRGAMPEGVSPLRDVLVTATALNLARIEAVEAWLAEHAEAGLFVAGKPGKPQPVLRDLSTWQAELRRQITTLEDDGLRRPAAGLARLMAIAGVRDYSRLSDEELEAELERKRAGGASDAEVVE